MAKGLNDLIAEAKQSVETVTPEDAHSSGDLILDVREPDEVAKARLDNALHVPRGFLEWHADPASQMANERLTAARDGGTVHVLCAAGGRAFLAADTLNRMGYKADVIEGGLSGWRKAGLPVTE